jgi:hypothetical protein
MTQAITGGTVTDWYAAALRREHTAGLASVTAVGAWGRWSQ